MRLQYILLFTFFVAGLCAAQQPTPAESANQQLQAWRKSRASTLMDDFGELSRYRRANASLSAPAPDENRVVFFGDSITDGWSLARYFPRKSYINRGISGQTTSQMLLRFRQDVVNLHPRAVVILAGTNDIAGNTGPMSLDETEANFASMAEIAHANGIRVVLSSLLPVHNYTETSQSFFALRPMQQITALNKWLRQYCDLHGDIYLDYFSPMLDSTGNLKREYADDGLHPNEAGYAVMAPLAESAIQKALENSAAQKTKPGN